LAPALAPLIIENDQTGPLWRLKSRDVGLDAMWPGLSIIQILSRFSGLWTVCCSGCFTFNEVDPK